MRKQIRIRRRVFAVLGASVVLSIAPLSTSFAGLANEVDGASTGSTDTLVRCQTLDAQQYLTVAKICRELNEESLTSGSGASTIQEPSHQASPDSYLENPFLWATVILAGVAGVSLAIIRRHHPAALS